MKRTLLAAALAALGTAALAEPGYVTQSSGAGPTTTPFGLCVHSGTWTPDQAVAPCDAVPRAAVPPAPVAQTEPQPEPAKAPEPEPLAQTESPRGPVLEKVSLSTDVLFEFGKADLKDSGKQKLDELAGRVQDANLEAVVATGHADRIGKDDANQKLSEARANAVKQYLDGKVATSNIEVAGKGEAEPVTGAACDRMGPEQRKNRKLVDCLQPDRRVEIEVFGTRTAAADSGSGTAGAGATRR
ncbi:MAG: OmpA-OmpF porin, family [Betaproteobacteria bacterium]|jgi:OOP family OmpA-OmpF porin|nr:OmpA-OmpF porin, family [Betaproteobacteria bacterium]